MSVALISAVNATPGAQTTIEDVPLVFSTVDGNRIGNANSTASSR